MRKAQRKPLAVTGMLFTAGFAFALAGLGWSFVDTHCYFSEAVRRSRCLENLARVARGKEEFRTLHSATNGAPVEAEQFVEFVEGGWPAMKCPGAGSYSLGAIGEKPSCSLHGAEP